MSSSAADIRDIEDVTVVSGASVVIGRTVIAADVATHRGSIIDIVAPGTHSRSARTIDGRGCTLAPGFVDVQLNGAAGFDFTTEPDRLSEIAAALPVTGVTSFLPTVITSSVDQMANAISVIGDGIRAGVFGARPVGLHVEGPFIAPQRRGAHPGRHVRDPDPNEAMRWLSSAPVALMTIAPELPGGTELIQRMVAAGVTVSVGHTAASVAEISAAVAAGATGATHLFNAMGTMSAREPGPAGAVIADERLIVGLIVDGLHVDPAMVLLAWRALGPDRVALVTDAMSALLAPESMAPDGEWWIGSTRINVGPFGARTVDGVLAGSVLRMDDAFRNLIAFTGCSVAEASVAASTTPARLLRRDDIGSIRTGARADLVLLDDRHQVVMTMIDGRVVHHRDGRSAT